MQRVQIFTLTLWLPMVSLVFWTLGDHVRAVRRLEWLTLWPKVTPFPQI